MIRVAYNQPSYLKPSTVIKFLKLTDSLSSSLPVYVKNKYLSKN